VPQAHDDGETAAEAIAGAAGSLVAALQGYVQAGWRSARRAKRGQRTIAVPPLAAAKLALYQAVRDRGISNVSLALMLGLSSESEVRRLLDLEHRSHIAMVASALALMGKEVVVEVRDAA
jgi:antitoxin HicB